MEFHIKPMFHCSFILALTLEVFEKESLKDFFSVAMANTVFAGMNF
jgi:hypothetical protein